jgi:hypothetical protein
VIPTLVGVSAQIWTLIALLGGGQITIMIALFTLRGELGGLRGEVRGEFGDLRDELREFRGEMRGDLTVIGHRLEHLERHPA